MLAYLDSLAFETVTVSHPPLFTVDDAKRLRGTLTGAHCKNLFLRNKKGGMWLVTVPEDRPLDLRQVGERIGAGRISFASEDRLDRYLGVGAGSVTPLAVINDLGGDVQVVLDDRMMREEAFVNVHPLTNEMTTTMKSDDLVTFLDAVNHAPSLIDFD